jgi:hypothetical protein
MDVGDQAKADQFAFFGLSRSDEAAGRSGNEGDGSFDVHETRESVVGVGQMSVESAGLQTERRRCLLQLDDPD